MKLIIPDPCLVVLIGPSGAGKSTFARTHFRPSEILSSDYCRYLVCDDENNQAATNDAFEVLHCICARRLRAGKLTVVDATNVQIGARRPLLALANEYNTPAVAIVLFLPEATCHGRNQIRTDRTIPVNAIQFQYEEMCRTLNGLEGEGFSQVFLLETSDVVAAVQIERQRSTIA